MKGEPINIGSAVAERVAHREDGLDNETVVLFERHFVRLVEADGELFALVMGGLKRDGSEVESSRTEHRHLSHLS